jgi:hypothetical protein
LTLALVTLSCNSTSPAPSTERWVYYSISSPDAATTARTGLYRYGINSRRYERVTSMSIDKLSGVAANGVIVMLSSAARIASNPDPLNTLFGRCENGSVIPVPFPVHPDPKREYALDAPGCIALAYNGHHAAYPVVDRPAGSTARDTTWKSGIVLFNCYTGKIQILAVDSFAQANFAIESPLRRCMAWVDGALLLSRDASTLRFNLLLGQSSVGSTGSGIQFVLWQNGVFRLLDPSLDATTAPSLRGWDEHSGAILARMDWMAPTLSVLTAGALPWRSTQLDAASVSSTGQWAVTRSRLVIAGPDGIELRNTADGSAAGTVLTYAQLFSNDVRALVTKPAEQIHLTISPDGEWIACAVSLPSSWPDPQSRTRLHIFRADGSDLRFIAQDASINASISDPLSQ